LSRKLREGGYGGNDKGRGLRSAPQSLVNIVRKIVPRPRRRVAFVERRESVDDDDADCPDPATALLSRARP
jgi:hypothetical protein